MRTFLLGLLFSSTIAIAGNGGMVGGGKWPSSLKLVIPEMDVGIRATVFQIGSYKILSMTAEDRDLLAEAALQGMHVEVKSELKVVSSLGLDVLDNGLVVLREHEGVVAFAVSNAE